MKNALILIVIFVIYSWMDDEGVLMSGSQFLKLKRCLID